MIKCKRERVNPKEAENDICPLDCIVKAALIGVDDSVAGQATNAFIMVAEGSLFSAKEVRKYCAIFLESFKVPGFIESRGPLPKSTNEKIDKKLLI